MTALVTALVALVLAVVLPLRYADVAGSAHAATLSAGTDSAGEHAAEEWIPYDAKRVAELAASGKPLLVNFTASWCLTCLVNERNAFSDAAVQAMFRDKGVTLMKGDWTNRDPQITKALAAFGRAGVPLYLAYNSSTGGAAPVVLPQLLTAAVVRDAFSNSPNRVLK